MGFDTFRIINKMERGICNYSMHVLLAPLHMVCIIYVLNTQVTVKNAELMLVITNFVLQTKKCDFGVGMVISLKF
jgi:hypothetical protein